MEACYLCGCDGGLVGQEVAQVLLACCVGEVAYPDAVGGTAFFALRSGF